MWETFAAQFASGAGKSLGGSLGGALGGSGAPVGSGVNLQGAAWTLDGGGWTVPVTITAASPAARIEPKTTGADGVPTWVLIAGGLGVLWLIARR